MTPASDIPSELEFVDPTAVDPTYRVVLFAAPGQGKSVAAASAPDPILVLTADRPNAYRVPRQLHPKSEIREVRYRNAQTLDDVYSYIRAGNGVRTIVVDPITNVVDYLLDELPQKQDRDKSWGPDYQAVNKKVLGFIKSLRAFDVHVVLVAHERVNDGNKGDGRIYPHIGGMTLINKTLAEMDIVAHVERHVSETDDGEDVQWIGVLQPRGQLVTKESTNSLGDRRIMDLSRWFDVADDALTGAVETGLPWADPPADETDDVEPSLLDEEA